MAGEDTDFWLALCSIGPVMFLALGALAVELVRERGLGWKRPAQKVQLIAINVSFLGTLLATVTAVLSIRATLSRQSRRGRSFHAWLGPSGIRGTSVEPVGTRNCVAGPGYGQVPPVRRYMACAAAINGLVGAA